jgi:hypothetical protein
MTIGPQDAVNVATQGWWTVAIGLSTIVISLLGSAVVGTWVLTWALGKSRIKVNEKIDTVALEFERRLKAEVDTSTRYSGESLAAFRQRLTEVETAGLKKITEVELYVRDTYVSKETFTLVVQELRDSFNRLADKLDDRFDGVDSRFNNMNDRFNLLDAKITGLSGRMLMGSGK